MERDPFLSELWKHKAEDEKSERKKTPYELYLRFTRDTEIYPSLMPLVSELKEAIGKYAESVAKFSHIRHSKDEIDKEDLQRVDSHRRLMHNNLVDVVNHLSREYLKLGIDNGWRSSIIGESREELGAWAMEVAKKALNHEEV